MLLANRRQSPVNTPERAHLPEGRRPEKGVQ